MTLAATNGSSCSIDIGPVRICSGAVKLANRKITVGDISFSGKLPLMEMSQINGIDPLLP